MEELLKWLSLALIVYFFLSSLITFLFMIFQFFRIQKNRRNRSNTIRIEKESCVPVSIVFSVLEDEEKLSLKMEHLLSLDYPSYEIVMVYDGKNEMFLDHVNKTFSLERIHHPYRRQIETKAVSAIYEGDFKNVHLTFIQKEKESFGDNLNVGINLARYPYLILLENGMNIQVDAISKLLYHMLSKENMVACGGSISITNEKGFFGWFQKRVYQRKSFLAFSKRPINRNDVKNLWMIKKECAFHLGGLSKEVDAGIPDFMCSLYDYCWDKDMDGAIQVITDSVGVVQAYSSWSDYGDSDSSILGKVLFHFLGFIILFLSTFFSVLPIVNLVIFLILYFIVEWIIFMICHSLSKLT